MKRIDPIRLRLLQQFYYGLPGQWRFATPEDFLRQETEHCFAKDLFANTPWKRRQANQELHNSEIKERVTHLYSPRSIPRIVEFESIGPQHLGEVVIGVGPRMVSAYWFTFESSHTVQQIQFLPQFRI